MKYKENVNSNILFKAIVIPEIKNVKFVKTLHAQNVIYH